MYLSGASPLRPSTSSCRSTTCAELPDDVAERVIFALDCANEEPAGRRAGGARARAVVVNVDHHHDNSRFGDVNLVVADASSTGEIVRDLVNELGLELTPELAEAIYVALVTDTGRFQYANTTPKALLAAELVEAGADVHRVFQSVYETVQLAKLKLLARALDRAQVYEGGGLVVSYLARPTSPRWGGGALLGGHHRLPPRRRGRARRFDPRASGAGVVRRDASAPPARARTSSTSRRSHGPRDGSGHRQAAGFSSSRDPGDRRLPPRAIPGSPCRRAGRSLGARAGRQAGGAVVLRGRSRPARPNRRARRPRGHARPVRDGPAARPPGPLDQARPAIRRPRQALPDRDRPVRANEHRRSGGRIGEQTPPSPEELEERLAALRGEVEPRVPAASAIKIEGERAYRMHRRGEDVEMPLRQSTIRSLELVEYDGLIATLDLLVGSGTHVRSIAAELGGPAVASAHRGRAVPRRRRRSARIIPAEEALGAL